MNMGMVGLVDTVGAQALPVPDTVVVVDTFEAAGMAVAAGKAEVAGMVVAADTVEPLGMMDTLGTAELASVAMRRLPEDQGGNLHERKFHPSGIFQLAHHISVLHNGELFGVDMDCSYHMRNQNKNNQNTAGSTLVPISDGWNSGMALN